MNNLKNVKLLFLILPLTLTGSCKKESHKQADCKISKLIRNNGQSYEFTYGENGRLSSMVFLPANEVSSFVYEGNTTTIEVTHNGNFQHRLIVTTNAGSFATNILLEQNQSGSDWYNQKITYDGNHIVKNEFSDSGGGTANGNYVWENGNPATYIVEGDVFNYTYYTDKPYRKGDWRDIQQMMAGYKIYQYENMVKTSTISTNTTYYTYLYDEEGRVKEATGSSVNNTNTFTIEYDCQ